MLIGILSDTHISKDMDFKPLINKLKKAFDGVELIIHAGDVCNIDFIVELEKIAPIEVVCGNSDDNTIRNKYLPFKVLSMNQLKIGISHEEISASLISQEKLNIVISGHTHIPEIREEPSILFLNPGSTTQPKPPPIRKMYQKQRPAMPTVILLEIDKEFSSAYIDSFK
jgi:putative phosphoesterase